jgi:hypothetical protein
VVATADPRTLPEARTWYLLTNLPVPGTTRAAQHPARPAAELAEVVRLYGLRQGIEQGDKPVKQVKQVKQELGWADFPVRSDRAIRRHGALVCCACAFCWWAASPQEGQEARQDRAPTAAPPWRSLRLVQDAGAGEKGGPLATSAHTDHAHALLLTARAARVPGPILATRAAAHPELA